MLNEIGYRSDVIELQLAHESNDRVRATYNKAQLMTERTKMMQEWADYLDSLRCSGTTILVSRHLNCRRAIYMIIKNN